MILTKYDTDKFNFYGQIRSLFNQELIFLNESDIGYTNSREAEQQTRYHKLFYGAFPDLQKMYIDFVRMINETHFLNDYDLYQKIPTFRVQFPGGKAVSGKIHKDSDYNHPNGEINILVPLTPMYGSSSLFIEQTPGKGDFIIPSANYGSVLIFDGNQCRHGNTINNTGLTRVSFDFRLIRSVDLYKDESKSSVSANIKFKEGEYYEHLFV